MTIRNWHIVQTAPGVAPSNPALSASELVNNGSAFADVNDDGGTLTVDSGAYLITAGGNAAVIADFSSVTVNGALNSLGASGDGLFAVLQSTTHALAVKVGGSGIVMGGVDGIISDQVMALTNAGMIEGGAYGVADTGIDGSINNAGAISGTAQGGIFFGGGGQHRIANSGNISGSTDAVLVIDGGVTLTNSGSVSGDIDLSGATAAVSVTQKGGDISGSILLGGAADAFNLLKGRVEGGVSAGGTGDKILVAGGTIDGGISMPNNSFANNTFMMTAGELGDAANFYDGANAVTISGGSLIGLSFGAGKNDLTITGGSFDGGIAFGNGTNKVTIGGGKIVDGLTLGNGNDSFEMTAGTIGGVVKIGNGNDNVTISGGVINQGLILGNGTDNLKITGGSTVFISLGSGLDTLTSDANREYVIAGGGSGTIMLGAGNDIFVGKNASDNYAVNGGGGSNTYIGSNISDGLVIDLDPQVDRVVDGASTLETLKNFQNADGGQGYNFFYGNSGANQLGGGNNGNYFDGGGGADILVGGSGVDKFVYKAASDSGPTAANRDTILEFTQGQDLIDVSAISSNFTFVGFAPLTNTGAPELGETQTAAGTIVWGDTKGHGVADFSILLKGIYAPLDKNDFVL